MLPTLQPVIQRLAAALPSACVLCAADATDVLCPACEAQYLGRQPARCRQCALPLPHAYVGQTLICGDCLAQTPSFDATIAATDYAAPTDQLVLALKFGGRLALAPFFARLLHRQAAQQPLPVLLTAVPLGSARLIERGFNQAHEIARPLARLLGLPAPLQLAVRVRDTAAQSSLPPEERRKNVRQAFAVVPTAIEQLRGAHIGIVDDVMTTGETLGELAATLKRFGAARVTNFVFARAAH